MSKLNTNKKSRSWIEDVVDKGTGQTLEEILQGFNMYFLSYTGNISATRNSIPRILRKRGLWITYVKYDNNVYTEWYDANEIDDDSWGNSSNWKIGNNSLVGDLTISSNGNWVINGTETEFKATGEKGITPVLRITNNKLQVSYDLGKSYIDVTDNPVYTKFRWLATLGDTQANNVGRIQASTDEGKTWTNMSNDFINNLHIAKYIGVDESLPTSGIAEGTIYAKGPYYEDTDTLQEYPSYRLWVYAWKNNTLAWQDNGEFTSITAGVVQETGDSETEVMSQKAVTEKFSELEQEANGFELTKGNNDYSLIGGKKYIFKNTGSVAFNIGYYNTESEYIKITSLPVGDTYIYIANESLDNVYISDLEGVGCVVYGENEIGGLVGELSVNLSSLASQSDKTNKSLLSLQESKDLIFYRGDVLIDTDLDNTTGLVEYDERIVTTKPIYNIDVNRRIVVLGTSYLRLYCYDANDGFIGIVNCNDGVILSEVHEKYKNTAYCRAIALKEEMRTLCINYGEVNIVNTKEFEDNFNLMKSDRETIFKTTSIGQYWINGDTGELKSSPSYKSITYRLGERYIGSTMSVTAGAAYTNEASIAFYSDEEPSVDNCIKLVLPDVVGINKFNVKIPDNTKAVVVSTRVSVLSELDVLGFLEKELTNIQSSLYSLTPKAVSISNHYINADNGGLEASSNYLAFVYMVDDRFAYGTIYATTGANSTSDASIAFYSTENPKEDSCIKTIQANIGVSEYSAAIPSGTKCIVISTRTQVYDAENVRIEAIRSVSNVNALIPLNLRVVSYNPGDYSGVEMSNGSEEAKAAYRKLLSHDKLTVVGVQADTNVFGDVVTKDAIWGMFKYYEQTGNTAYNYKAFASDIPVYGIEQIYYTGGTYSHPYFLKGVINVNGKMILIISIHLDWQDKTTRAAQYQQIVNYTDAYDNVMVMGDTNCENYENGVLIDNTILINEWDIFTEHGFVMANNGYFGLKNTFYGSGGEPIDNIFVKGDITINNFEVIQKDWMNDHYMVVADLSIY